MGDVNGKEKGMLIHWTGINFENIPEEQARKMIDARGIGLSFSQKLGEQMRADSYGFTIGPIVGDEAMSLMERVKYIRNAIGNVMPRTDWYKSAPSNEKGRKKRVVRVVPEYDGLSCKIHVFRIPVD